jgi:hypothetical protein
MGLLAEDKARFSEKKSLHKLCRRVKYWHGGKSLDGPPLGRKFGSSRPGELSV